MAEGPCSSARMKQVASELFGPQAHSVWCEMFYKLTLDLVTWPAVRKKAAPPPRVSSHTFLFGPRAGLNPSWFRKQ